MSKIRMLAVALATLPVLVIAAPAYAITTGQIEGGNIYRIKNLTKGTDFADPASADACNELMYKVRLHNPGPGALSNVIVKATLPATAATSHTSTVTVSATNADPSSTSDTAVVNLSSSQSLSYVSGSTQLLNSSNGFLQNLSDGITGSGVNIGNLGVSIEQIRFVQFKVKVSCPEQPKPKAQISIRKIAEDSTGKELSAVPTNTFTFKVTCDGKTSTVTYSSTPQAAGECTVGSTVTVTENAVDGWVILSPSTQSFTVAEGGLTVVFKNRQKPVVKPAVTPPAPTKGPTVLPKTGAGSVVALFTGVSALAGAGHYIVRRYIA